MDHFNNMSENKVQCSAESEKWGAKERGEGLWLRLMKSPERELNSGNSQHHTAPPLP